MQYSSINGHYSLCCPSHCIENSILERAKDMRNNLENASGDITVLLNKLGKNLL